MRKKKRNAGITVGCCIAVLIGLLVLIGCHSSGEPKVNAVIGKWYNEDGKCLDIRSDKSWKLEDSYGTGTWKQLDGGMYEFTDFYGDTQESAINEDTTGQYIDFGYYGHFYKNKSTAGGSQS